MGPGHGSRADCESGGAPADDCGGGLVAEHARGDYRGCGVLRCEREERFREISRKAEGRGRDLYGAGGPLAAQAGGSARADEPTYAATSAAVWRATARGSVCGFPEGGERADGGLEAGRGGGGGAARAAE